MRWAELPLQQVAEVVSGFGFPKDYQGDTEGEYPFLKVSDMNLPGNEVWMYESTNTISQEILSKLGAKVFPPGTVIFPKIGAAIATGKKRILFKPSTFDNNVMGLVPKAPILAPFLYYWSLTFDFQDIANIGPVPSLRKTTVEKLPILLPPISEQRRIVEILDQADALRKKRAEADEKSDRILPALFIKMFGDPSNNPMNWDVKTLGNLDTDFRYGTSVKCDSEPKGIPVLRIPNIIYGEIDRSDLKYAELSDLEIERLLLQEGDLLFVRTNGNPDYVGRSAVFDLKESYLFASYLIRARLNQDVVNPWFVAACLATPAGRQIMSPFIRTTAGQSNISVDGLKQISLPLPPIEKQRYFQARVVDFYHHRKTREQSKSLLEKTFQNLLHNAFSGALTAEWRKAHLTEILQEMEHQSKVLGIPHTVEYEQLALSDLP